MKKILSLTLCSFLTLSIVGCSSDPNKQIEEKLLNNGYYIEATSEAISLNKYYEEDEGEKNIFFAGFAYNKKDGLSFEDEYLYEGRLNLENKEFTNVISDIEPRESFAEDITNRAEDLLKQSNITISELEEYCKYKIENDPNSVDPETEIYIPVDERPAPIITTTEKYYTDTINIDYVDLDILDNYSYDGVEILPDDINRTLRTVRQAAMYRKVSALLQGFDAHFHDGSKLSVLCLDEPTSSREEFEPHYNNLITFIVPDEEDPLIKVINKLESLNSVSGTFDYENEKFEFTIKNTLECAKEMGISERLLGYIFAMLDEYAPTINFTNTGLSFSVDVNRTTKSL